MRRHYGLVIFAAAILVFAIYIRLQRRWDKHVDAKTVSQTLAPQDEAKVVIDQKRHEAIEIVRTVPISGTGSKTVERRVYLPPTAAIEIEKDGQVKVIGRTFGTEFSPYFGGGFGSDLRFSTQLGAGLLYWQRWEFGLGLGIVPQGSASIRGYVAGTYNVWSNTIIGITYDTHGAVGGMVAVKF